MEPGAIIFWAASVAVAFVGGVFWTKRSIVDGDRKLRAAISTIGRNVAEALKETAGLHNKEP